MELPVNQILCGDCVEVMKTFPAESVDMSMFSPPYYGLRDYQIQGQIGLEPTWKEYIMHIIDVCREIKRLLKKVGSMYMVMGDIYAGSHCGKGDKTLFQNYRRLKVAENLYEKDGPQAKATGYQPKCLMGIPWRLAFILIDDGWILRNDIIWHKPNAMPSSVKDRLTTTYEHIFHFVKRRKYYYDLDAIRLKHQTLGDKAKHGFGKKSHGGRKKNIKGSETSAFHVHGKNPGDVIKIDMHHGSSLTKGRACHYKNQHIESSPKGKNPGDVVSTKHDLAVNRVGDFSYTDPLHAKAYNIKGKNPGDYWGICTKPFKGAHFAVYPEKLCVKPIKSSCPPNGIVLDPMCGSGTTCVVAKKLGRNYIGIDLNPDYIAIAKKRLSKVSERLTSFFS